MKRHETGSTLEWIRIQEEDFSTEEEVNRIKERSKRIGGIVTFLGTARDFSKGKDIQRIDFEFYPGMAEKKLNEIRERALADYNLIEVSIIHRVGRIEIGDNIVLIVVAAQHRKDAFKACEWCIDELKRVTPIWKREETNDGEVWVVEHP
jgi:molybdopterin synthase catalytic subunit